MNQQTGQIMRLEQKEYLQRLLPDRDLLLREMERFADEHNVPIADPEVATFLEITVRAIKAKRVLEIGTAIGYADIFMARAMSSDGKVITIDVSDEMIGKAQEYVKRAGLEDRVEFHRGPALTIIPSLEGPFDLVYLDAVIDYYGLYLDPCLDLTAVGGVLLANGLLWKGQVATTPTSILRSFNYYFLSHPQLHSVILPIADGVGYGVKLTNSQSQR